jgi:RNA polymerase sigma-70 factor (ECF subfamily)
MTAASAQTAHVQALFVQHLPALRGFVLSLTADFSVVDDVVQETFVTVTEKANAFERGSNFRAWAWTIARFKTLQQLQKTAASAQNLSPQVIEALCADPAAEGSFAEKALRYLGPCLEQLAPRARQAIELRYQQAHRPSEIAQQMGWTVEAVHVALARARVALRDCVTRQLTDAERV